MSYAKKIGIYQGDCKVILGRHEMFSSYIQEFAKSMTNTEVKHGLDLGTGPSGCNGSFFVSCILDGCDIEQEVIDSLSEYTYTERFLHSLGTDILPYEDNSLDFLVCSCVIQHLNSFTDLEKGLREIQRVLKTGGQFYLMFKVGTNDTLLTHTNSYYSEERTFRVFSLESILSLSSSLSFNLLSSEYLLDENYIPYCCAIFRKL